MGLPNFFISCDWGTTNFRLRLVETHTLNIISEHKTAQGIKVLYEKYVQQKEVSQKQYFIAYLQEQIQVFPPEYRDCLTVMAGMASSNIGLHELPYADFPIEKGGANLLWKHLPLSNSEGVLLISGVKAQQGMMRGEEIQAVGLEEQLTQYSKGILLLPGTHSKHLTYSFGEFQGIKNYMTGELFEILSKNSILANSVTTNQWNPQSAASFKVGLALGFEGELTSSLFSVRTNHVLNDTKKEDNYFYLSGLLIGDELSYLKNHKDYVFLAAPEPIFGLYQLALTSLLDDIQLVCFDNKKIENALLIGQRKILTQYVKKQAVFVESV